VGLKHLYTTSDGEQAENPRWYRQAQKRLWVAQALREALGPHYPLMFDAYMGWDLPYATGMVRALEPLRPAWVEEPIPPERVTSLRQIRQAAAEPFVTGEHVYTRWQAKELLANQALDVLQVDPDWTGGISYQETKPFFHTPIVRPQAGLVRPPELPGLGIVLDEAKIDERKAW
jgi:L-alanine-DL-glutamate epimerase-like enolase superfamily enzyme